MEFSENFESYSTPIQKLRQVASKKTNNAVEVNGICGPVIVSRRFMPRLTADVRFKKMNASTTPNSINDAVKLICEKIGSPSPPIYVDVKASPDKKLWNECHPNVDLQVATHGGEAIRGWCVFEHPGQLIEGIFHSIWKRPDGTFVDPTPQMDGETRILFIPDPRLEWKGYSIPSHRIALSKERWIARKIAIAEGNEELERKYRTIQGQKPQIPLKEILEMILRHTTRNDLCPCESGRKYKHCCEGKGLDALLSAMLKEAYRRYGPPP